MATYQCIDRVSLDNRIRNITEKSIPNHLHDFTCEPGVVLKQIFLLKSDPSHKHWNDNLTPDLVVYVVR